jgi:hypothetical protein
VRVVAYHGRMAADTRPPTGTPAAVAGSAGAVPEQVAPAIGTGAAPSVVDAADALTRPAVLCPYLRMADGSHRALATSRDHRCWAVDPPGAVSAQVQSELCLGAAHTACERYVAARDHRAVGLAADHIPPHLIGSPRYAVPIDPVPVAVDARAPGRDAGPMAGTVSRRRLPALLIAGGVMLLSVVVLAALLAGGILGTTHASPTPALAALAASTGPTSAPTPRPTRTPTATPTERPTSAPASAPAGEVVPETVGPTPPVATTPIPSFEVRRLYLVKEGDTWQTIATRFGLRPKDLKAVNGPLVVGEKIVIPAGPVVPPGS